MLQKPPTLLPLTLALRFMLRVVLGTSMKA
jgi:hypothetical protein